MDSPAVEAGKFSETGAGGWRADDTPIPTTIPRTAEQTATAGSRALLKLEYASSLAVWALTTSSKGSPERRR